MPKPKNKSGVLNLEVKLCLRGSWELHAMELLLALVGIALHVIALVRGQ